MAKQAFTFNIEDATIVRAIAAFKGLNPIPEGTLNGEGKPITDVEWGMLKIREFIQLIIRRWERAQAVAQAEQGLKQIPDDDFEVSG